MHIKGLVSVGNHSLLFFYGHHILLAVYGIALSAVNLNAACAKIAAKALCGHIVSLSFFCFLILQGPPPVKSGSHPLSDSIPRSLKEL